MNPIVTFEMKDGGIIKAELVSGNCTQYSQQFHLSGEKRLL